MKASTLFGESQGQKLVGFTTRLAIKLEKLEKANQQLKDNEEMMKMKVEDESRHGVEGQAGDVNKE